MHYPIKSEYIAAIKDAAGNLDKLSILRPVLDDNNEPVYHKGASAIVFKMVSNNGKYYALKCFTEEQVGRSEAYCMITQQLNCVDSQHLISIKYYEEELLVNSTVTDVKKFPVLLMNWVDGVDMDFYIANNYSDNNKMSLLCKNFCEMAAWLRSQPFAHGDIKPSNIIIREDGELVLIDYDGMYVPAMKGQKSPTSGTNVFAHPSRTNDDFDETIDDFSLTSIALSLRAISLDSSLYLKYAAPDRLLFSHNDFNNFGQTNLFRDLSALFTDKDTMRIFGLFIIALSTGNLSSISLNAIKPSKIEEQHQQANELIEDICEVSDEECWKLGYDETGAIYSRDGKRLLKVKSNVGGLFIIKDGTEIICNRAFRYSLFSNIAIPSSVKFIGRRAFQSSAITSIILPDSVLSIRDRAFSACRNLTTIVLPSSLTRIEESTFDKCCSLSSVKFPVDLAHIGSYAFRDCTNLKSIMLPPILQSIETRAFSGCLNLPSISFPNGLKSIGCFAFEKCKGLKSISIPSSVTLIDEYAFSSCTNLTSIDIQSNNLKIGDFAFSYCRKLTSVRIPKGVKFRNKAFYSRNMEMLLFLNSIKWYN